MEIVKTFKKIEPFIALGILISLLVTATLLYQENKISKEISKTCGWGDEDFYCVCEKNLAFELRNILEDQGEPLINLSDVKVDG